MTSFAPRVRTSPERTLPFPGDSLAELADRLSRESASASRADKETRGQFFTPLSIARFMADLLGPLPPELRLLDPGAGCGVLNGAVLDRVLESTACRSVSVTAYETDSRAASALRKMLSVAQKQFEVDGRRFAAQVHERDFILSNREEFEEPTFFSRPARERFNAIVMNPPYFKIGKDHPASRAMSQVVHGQPNIYALFMAMGAALLSNDGALVSITPRSFASGSYFLRFRRWFFDQVTPWHIHIFESRREAFGHEGVLQENVILKVRPRKPTAVRLSRSVGADELAAAKLEARTEPVDHVLDDLAGERILRIPVTPEDSKISEVLRALPASFRSLGFKISTGPVVSFRARRFLLDDVQERSGVVPLLQMHNVKPMRTDWPVARPNKPASIMAGEESRPLLVPTKRYVLLKRFSSKEQLRRITASVLDPAQFQSRLIGLENHLNYVYRPIEDLDELNSIGLAAFLNSALVDRYFRISNGHTQVNAGDISGLPMPQMPTLRSIGRKVLALQGYDRKATEEIIAKCLELSEELERSLLESC